jgi:hypothetical protein
MLYEAPEVPGQEKEPIQRVTQPASRFSNPPSPVSSYSSPPPSRYSNPPLSRYLNPPSSSSRYSNPTYIKVLFLHPPAFRIKTTSIISRDPQVRVEAAGVLAQITSPWIAGRGQTKPSQMTSILDYVKKGDIFPSIVDNECPTSTSWSKVLLFSKYRNITLLPCFSCAPEIAQNCYELINLK